MISNFLLLMNTRHYVGFHVLAQRNHVVYIINQVQPIANTLEMIVLLLVSLYFKANLRHSMNISGLSLIVMTYDLQVFFERLERISRFLSRLGEIRTRCKYIRDS